MARFIKVVAATVLMAGSALVSIAPGASAAPRAAESDFNGDGYSDLVVASPNDATTSGIGGFYVVPGASAGIAPAKSKWFAFADSHVGVHTTTGDFDGDGYDDLAVSSESGFSPDSFSYRGTVRVLFGSSSGLTTQGMQVLTPGSGEIPDGLDRFGEALTAGDFDNDGFDELAIGAPASMDAESSNPKIWVFTGSNDGLSTSAPVAFSTDTSGLDTPADAPLGESLASGDFDGDGFDDLAAGRSGSAYLTILPGSADGVTTTGLQTFSIGDVGQPTESGPSPYVLEVGSFGRTDQDDLALGTRSGTSVAVLYGTGEGLATANKQLWDKNTLSSIPGAAQDYGRFGFALAAGDYGYSNYDDLAIGAHEETVKTSLHAGSVTVIVGTANGLVATHGKRWTQDSTGISGVSEKDDWFGQTLKAGLFNKSSKAGLGISAAMEAIGTKKRAGGVNVLYGSSSALTSTGNSFLTQDTAGMTGVTEQDDFTGFSGTIEPDGGH
jgi:hypothetical protein